MPIGQSSRRLQDVFSETISSGEISPASPPTRSAQSQPDLLSDVEPIGSARGDGKESSCMVIAIAVKAHEKMRVEPFAYVFQSLIQRHNCKVVVICCLSRVHSEWHSLLIGDNSFNGISKKMLAAAKTQQKKNWDHFLAAFRVALNSKGIQLDIHIPVGRKSEDILVDAAKTLHPLWVVLDSSWASFSGNQQKTIKAALPECNLVLMKNSKPLILQFTTQPNIPRDQENLEDFGSNTSSPISRNSGSNPESPTITPETTSSRPITPIITTETPSSNLTSTSTITTETPSTSNQIASSNISTASSTSHQSTPTIPRETSSPNQIISRNHRSTAIMPTEMSSSNSNRATPTIPSETSSTSNGTTPTTPMDMPCSERPTPTRTPGMPSSNRSTTLNPEASTSDGTTATRTTEASQAESGTSTRAVATHPLPTKSPVVSQGLKYLVDRVTFAGTLFPSLGIPLFQSTATLSSEIGGSPPESPSTLSESPDRNTPLNPTLGTADSPRQSTVDQPNEGNSRPQNEDMSDEIALKVAIEASIRSARAEGVPVSLRARNSSSSNKRGASASRPHGGTAADVGVSFAPSAPPLPSYDPFVDSSPVSANTSSTAEHRDDLPAKLRQKAEDERRGRCVICWSAPAEAACVPCGHIAGCQSCLNQAQHWGCPVCRAKIRQVLKVYAV